MQFYLFFPLLLLFLEKLKKSKLNVIITLTLTSMFLSFWMSITNKDANFYLLTSRIWEIMAGAICYFLTQSRRKTINKNYCEILSLFAIFLILTSFFLFDKETRHPSYFTLIPIVSTMILISFSQNTFLTKKILENRVINYFGLISYSLYIIHFPVLAILNYNSLDINLEFTLLTILFFSFLSWNYIEKPFRNREKISSKKIFTYYFSSSFLLVTIGLYPDTSKHLVYINYLLAELYRRTGEFEKAAEKIKWASKNNYNDLDKDFIDFQRYLINKKNSKFYKVRQRKEIMD